VTKIVTNWGPPGRPQGRDSALDPGEYPGVDPAILERAGSTRIPPALTRDALPWSDAENEGSPWFRGLLRRPYVENPKRDVPRVGGRQLRG
jgi:hypothetical protein